MAVGEVVYFRLDADRQALLSQVLVAGRADGVRCG
jgi:hypothetical protein